MRSNNLKNKRKKGAVLVFALIILSVMLISGLAIAATTITAMKGSISSDKSVQAFQIAESGIELTLRELSTTGNCKPNPSVFCIRDFIGSCELKDGQVVISGNIGTDKNYELTFEDASGPIDDCNNDMQITKIKSVGTFQGVSRAVETSSSN
jgi:Tfp pilus assembly protein PilX